MASTPAEIRVNVDVAQIREQIEQQLTACLDEYRREGVKMARRALLEVEPDTSSWIYEILDGVLVALGGDE